MEEFYFTGFAGLREHNILVLGEIAASSDLQNRLYPARLDRVHDTVAVLCGLVASGSSPVDRSRKLIRGHPWVSMSPEEEKLAALSHSKGISGPTPSYKHDA